MGAKLRNERRFIGLCRDCCRPSGDFVLCEKCRDIRKEYQRQWRSKADTKEHIKKYKQDYKTRPGVKERETKYQKKYMQGWKIRPGVRKAINERNKEKRKNNIQYKLSTLLRVRLRDVLKGRIKNGSSVADLGCSLDFLKYHIESQFTTGMSWNNHGRGDGCWVIDHIKPLSSADLTDRVQFLGVCNYKNLRPMWFMDNIRKGFKSEKAWIDYQEKTLCLSI